VRLTAIAYSASLSGQSDVLLALRKSVEPTSQLQATLVELIRFPQLNLPVDAAVFQAIALYRTEAVQLQARSTSLI